MDKYYEKAQCYIQNEEVEEAITAFIAGLDRGDIKCAYGIVHAVTNFGSYTMTEYEAISLFSSFYSKIKILAEAGDTEAMVMVAEGIRYGYVDDDDEPYLFWLTKAAELGDRGAMAIIEELDLSDDPWALPCAASFVTAEACDSMDSTDMILLDDRLALEVVDDMKDVTEIPEEHVLMDDPDWVMREQYGINAYFKERERKYELYKCMDYKVVDCPMAISDAGNIV